MRFVCTSHSNRTALIQKAAAGFIDNGWVGGALLLEIRCKTAALNHEAVNDTMKNRTVIKAFVGIANKVGDRNRGALSIQTHGKVAERRRNLRNRLILGSGNGRTAEENGGQGRR